MKRILSLALVLVTLLGLLAGCGKSTESTEPTATTQDIATTEAPETTATEEETTREEETTTEAPSFLVDTTILKEADSDMLNTYSLIAVDPEAPFVDADGKSVTDVAINSDGADALIQWLLSEEALNLAGSYGLEEYGEVLFYVLAEAPVYTGPIQQATPETATIRLSTTTSVNDSGLLAHLLPHFEIAYGYTVEVQSAGTGKAIAAAKNGNADLILVHSKKQETAFIDEDFGRKVAGFDSQRISFLYNYFVLCGPSADPAGVADAPSVLDAFASIAEGGHLFVSRGDSSGTHTKELALWPENLGITAEATSFQNYTDWYISANTGMGACLVMAEQMGAYILADKATFLTFRANDGCIG